MALALVNSKKWVGLSIARTRGEQYVAIGEHRRRSIGEVQLVVPFDPQTAGMLGP
jgi:hypothetical protein